MFVGRELVRVNALLPEKAGEQMQNSPSEEGPVNLTGPSEYSTLGEKVGHSTRSRSFEPL